MTESAHATRWIAPPPDGTAEQPMHWWAALGLNRASGNSGTIEVTADARFTLWLEIDGERRLIGRGPHRGTPASWCVHRYALSIPSAPCRLLAFIESGIGELGTTSAAQLSISPGFWLRSSSFGDLTLDTGIADWRVTSADGFRWRFPSDVPNSRLAGGEQWMDVARFDAARDAEQSHWSRASVSESDEHRTLEPTPLPEMLHRRWRGGRVCNVTGPLEAAEWQSWWTGQVDRIVVPAESKAEVLIDLDDYLCAFVSLHVEQGAGATVDVAWAEALVAGGEEPHFDKGQRDEVEGKRFIGRADTFVFDGQPRTAETLWWRAGRFIQLTIRTGDEPLILLALQFDETRYPLDWRDLPPTGDSEFDAAVPLMQRSIETCVHETFMDCPYYEQIQYLGDTRLQALVTYTLCDDDRPGMRAIKLFAAAQRPDGLLPSRLPCTKDQLIPGFCLAWVGMLHDLAIWRGRPEFVSDMLPTSRRLVDAFARLVGGDDLLGPLPDWRFVDWVPTWQNGVPADTHDTPDAIHSAWLVIALRQLAQLEAWVGDADISRSHAALAERLSAAGKRAFWSDQRSLFSNAPDCDAFSEHAQCLAVLADWITGDDAGDLLRRCSDADVAKTTIYFRHYRFEALTHVGLSDSILDELDEWRDLPARGLKTTPEMPEPTRSDNHAWGAHPLFHVVAPRLGLRPTPLPHTPTPQ